MNPTEVHPHNLPISNEQQNSLDPRVRVSSQQSTQILAARKQGLAGSRSRQLKVVIFFLLVDGFISFEAWHFFMSIFDNTYGVWSAGYGTFAAGMTFAVFGFLMLLGVIFGITFAYQSLAFYKKTRLDTEIRYYGIVRKLHGVNIILGFTPAVLFLGSVILWISVS